MLPGNSHGNRDTLCGRSGKPAGCEPLSRQMLQTSKRFGAFSDPGTDCTLALIPIHRHQRIKKTCPSADRVFLTSDYKAGSDLFRAEKPGCPLRVPLRRDHSLRIVNPEHRHEKSDRRKAQIAERRIVTPVTTRRSQRPTTRYICRTNRNSSIPRCRPAKPKNHPRHDQLQFGIARFASSSCCVSMGRSSAGHVDRQRSIRFIASPGRPARRVRMAWSRRSL